MMVNGQQIATDHHCDFLLVESGRCAIFSDRHMFQECLPIERMIEEGTVPKWCPYVVDDVEYQARADTRLYNFKVIDLGDPRRKDASPPTAPQDPAVPAISPEPEKCPICHGLGYLYEAQGQRCEYCHGTGNAGGEDGQ